MEPGTGPRTPASASVTAPSTGSERTPDRGRSAVYAAEDQVARLLDRGGEVDFYGSRLTVPAQRRFGDLRSVRAYLDAVRDTSWGHGDLPAPRVRPGRSERKAHWSAPDRISIPVSADWAMTEMVVLHEYAHHVSHHLGHASGHGPPFRRVFVQLVTGAIGAEAGLLLVAALDQAGVGMGSPASRPSR